MDEDLTLDIVREVINIGIGDAAAALSELVHDRVTIELPEVHIVESKKAPEFLKKELTSLGVYISQKFTGAINGKTLLFYTKESCQSIIKTVLKKDSISSALTDTAISTLQEIGNILMVSCISTIGDIIEDKIFFEIPDVTIEISEGYLGKIINDLNEMDKTIIIRNQMMVKKQKIQGYIFLFLGFNDFLLIVDKMKKKIKSK